MAIYRVLGDIAYEAGRDEGGRPVVATAAVGEFVTLTAKDAAALTLRGDVLLHEVDVVQLEPIALPPYEE